MLGIRSKDDFGAAVRLQALLDNDAGVCGLKAISWLAAHGSRTISANIAPPAGGLAAPRSMHAMDADVVVRTQHRGNDVVPKQWRHDVVSHRPPRTYLLGRSSNMMFETSVWLSIGITLCIAWQTSQKVSIANRLSRNLDSGRGHFRQPSLHGPRWTEISSEGVYDGHVYASSG